MRDQTERFPGTDPMKNLPNPGPIPERTCCDCRNGEHVNFDDDVRLTVVRDTDANRIVKRGYLCSEHRTAYEMDGYVLILK